MSEPRWGPRSVGYRGTRLTPRQWEVVRRLALGQTWKVICADLQISRMTMWRYRQEARERYGVQTVVELYAALGWLEVPAA